MCFGLRGGGVWGVGEVAGRIASIETKRVYADFHPLSIVKDRNKLTRYLTNRWVTIVSEFM